MNGVHNKYNLITVVIYLFTFFSYDRHEMETRNLSFDNGQDIRDPFGYYFCMKLWSGVQIFPKKLLYYGL